MTGRGKKWIRLIRIKQGPEYWQAFYMVPNICRDGWHPEKAATPRIVKPSIPCLFRHEAITHKIKPRR